MQSERYVIGVDTGGTFTDITVMTESGEVFVGKSPTTPLDASQGVVDSVRVVAETMEISVAELLSRCEVIKIGTTVATNALINRTGSRVGLITTKGFEDTTLIMRAIGRVAGLSEDELKHQTLATKPTPLVPKQLIKGVTERIDFRGNEIIPLNVEEAQQAIRSLVEEHNVEAIAVNLLFGFVNPTHETKISSLVREIYPDRTIPVTLASELIPVVREYARSNTASINCFLAAPVNAYVNSLSTQFEKMGYQNPLLFMQANGGIVFQEQLQPINLLGSGPSGGIVASRFIAELLGHAHVISTDMGGTSFDVGILIDGSWRYTRDPVVERFHITWPMIDIESIGAGGGTIAHIHPVTKNLLVGPSSAGADPGPVCYGRGNMDPTVTDADVLLGFINPDYFLGGRIKLDKEKAEQAIKERIADPLDMSAIEAAAGIYEIANANMADLIRKKVVQTGATPEEEVLYAFGGAGPVHAGAIASELGIKNVYVFPTGAVFSSFGIAMADIILSHMQSFRKLMPVDPEELNTVFSKTEETLLRRLQHTKLETHDIEFQRTLHMRYRRQLNELELKVPTRRYGAGDVREIMDGFEKRYEEVYGTGSAYSPAGIEIIWFTVDAIAKTKKPKLKSSEDQAPTRPKTMKGIRKVFFPGNLDQFIDTKIYDFMDLNPGNILDGPCIVETPVTTVVVPPEKNARVDKYHNIQIMI